MACSQQLAFGEAKHHKMMLCLRSDRVIKVPQQKSSKQAMDTLYEYVDGQREASAVTSKVSEPSSSLRVTNP
jgi:hypothetical protein